MKALKIAGFVAGFILLVYVEPWYLSSLIQEMKPLIMSNKLWFARDQAVMAAIIYGMILMPFLSIAGAAYAISRSKFHTSAQNTACYLMFCIMSGIYLIYGIYFLDFFG